MRTVAPTQKQYQDRTSVSLARSNNAIREPVSGDRRDLPELTRAAPPRFRHDFRRTPIHAPAIAIQPKLTIGISDDQYEQKADRVADRVMRMTKPNTVAGLGASTGISGVQRKCACERGDGCQEKQEHEHPQLRLSPLDS